MVSIIERRPEDAVGYRTFIIGGDSNVYGLKIRFSDIASPGLVDAEFLTADPNILDNGNAQNKKHALVQLFEQQIPTQAANPYRLPLSGGRWLADAMQKLGWPADVQQEILAR